MQFARLDLSPVEFADHAGATALAPKAATGRAELGQYMTPPDVARFMAARVPVIEAARLLDPGAGAGILAAAVIERVASRGAKALHVVAYEVDPELRSVLHQTLSYASEWAASRHCAVTFDVKSSDFVLDNARAARPESRFHETPDAFDSCIANPPYFKVGKRDPRAEALTAVVHGQPNIYMLFMATGAALLRPGGTGVFITPRSYAAGPYFRAFRRFFFSRIRPTHVHLFESRRDAFGRDEVLQENVILCGERDAARAGESVFITSSTGTADLVSAPARVVPLRDVVDEQDADRILRIPTTEDQLKVVELVQSWPQRLATLGMDISTGPVVPFRTEELRTTAGPDTAPMLWMQHVSAMSIRWPLGNRKPEHIRVSEASKSILLPTRPYVILRRFSAKEEERRLTASPLFPSQLAPAKHVGLENHLNYVYRKGGNLTPAEAFGLAVLFNSRLLDVYFRTSNGNTQVSATEIRALPLPPLSLITRLGELAQSTPEANPDILLAEAGLLVKET